MSAASTGTYAPQRRSANPDFTKLVRESARYVKVVHAANNWQNLPRAIERDINRLADNIKPPGPTDDLRRQLSHAADDFKAAVTAAVQDHLQKTASAVKSNIQSLNQQDVSMVHATVRRQMQRPVNKRVLTTTVDRALGDLAVLPTTHSEFPRLGASSDDDDDDVEDELDDLVEAVQRSSKQQPSTDTPGKRVADRSPGSLPPAKAHASTDRHYVVPLKHYNNKLVLAPEKKGQWMMPSTIPVGCKVLAITGSNGANWRAPGHIFVVALRGGRIRDATRLLKTYMPPPSLARIVVALGTNNRRDGSDVINSELTELHTTMSHTSRVCPCSFMEVPEHPLASPQERDGADYINLSARDLFADKFINLRGIHIQAARPNDGAHYNQQTADQVVARLTSATSTASLN